MLASVCIGCAPNVWPRNRCSNMVKYKRAAEILGRVSKPCLTRQQHSGHLVRGDLPVELTRTIAEHSTRMYRNDFRAHM